MDGNRRFAKAQGLMAVLGHQAGYDKLKEVVRWAKEAGVKYLVVYAFSTENWNRPKEEVDYLMNLFKKVLTSEKEKAEVKKEGIRLRYIGNLLQFDEELQRLIARAEEETKDNKEITLVSAVSYGGRQEITDMVNKLIKEKNGESVTLEDIDQALYTHDIPDPDLILRTSGELRTSGFLPWQSVYSELFFVDTKWPALTKDEFLNVLEQFSNRQRRNGK